MKINKSLDIDLNILSPQKHIRIHEGDVDSVDILIGVSVDDETVDLDGITIKYDATINNYLAEQDADGSVVDDKISIPVTQNMTAMSGLLLIDVRMIQSDQILFTQTICATVEKAVVNGSTYIDLNKITIIQRMNALEEKMDYIEELVENFDTSKLIISVNRPPMGAPVEVDVDLLRVGDTWILSGDNIVYKLVEARYNYSPAPDIEPQHYFTWQPLNERFWRSNLEPPTTVTYQEVVYTINEVQWSWLPVPEYFQGDHYQMQIGFDDPTYYICESASIQSTDVYTYTWREEGGSIDAYTKAETNALLADKMDLAPINPTTEEIEDMPDGQLYSDTVNHKGIIKGGQEFYDTNYIDDMLSAKEDTENKAISITAENKTSSTLFPTVGATIQFIENNYKRIFKAAVNPPSNQDTSSPYVVGDIWVNTANQTSWVLEQIATNPTLQWKRLTARVILSDSPPPAYVDFYPIIPPYCAGDIWIHRFLYNSTDTKPQYLLNGLYICVGEHSQPGHPHNRHNIQWYRIITAQSTLAGYGITDAYTKNEINQKGYLTLETLPIYDGTVI